MVVHEGGGVEELETGAQVDQRIELRFTRHGGGIVGR
jgi:hypothetical protein